MTVRTWTSLKGLALRQITKTCPDIADHTEIPGITSIVALLALSMVKFDTAQPEGSTEVKLEAVPLPPDDEPVQRFLSEIVKVINDHVRISGSVDSIDFSGWLDRNGFADTIVRLISMGFDTGEVSAFANVVAAAVGTLTKRVEELAHAHRKAVFARDLPQFSCKHGSLSPNAVWLLAPETSGEPGRPETLKRRLQAFHLYGALPTVLRRTDITAIIDEGKPLTPAIMDHVGLSAPELKALRGSRSFDRAIGLSTDFERAVEQLKAYDVPLPEWPGKGLPDQADAWETSPWVKQQRGHIVRLDYLDENGTSVQDALHALRDDLLRPLAAERIRLGGFKGGYRLSTFARDLQLDPGHHERTVRQGLLTTLHRAIAGSRKPKAFREAVDLWHRRAASLAALRHESQADRPGWPALCAPWKSACGRYEIVPLVSAADLVEEGNQLEHCVGGYYETCRKGDVHILSVRDDGRHAATAEITLGDDLRSPSLNVGQFKARRNTAPAANLYDALRDFLRAVRSGAHPMNVDRLARYRKRMRDTWDGVWRSDALSLDHARKVYRLHRPILPRDAPSAFDEWCERSGLPSAIDRALRAVASEQPARGTHPITF